MCDALALFKKDNNVEDVVETIHCWLSSAELTNEDKMDKLHFTEDEINQLANTIIDKSNLS